MASPKDLPLESNTFLFPILFHCLDEGLGIDCWKSLFRPKKDHPIQEPDWHRARPHGSLSRRAVHRAICVSFASFVWYTNKQIVVAVAARHERTSRRIVLEEELWMRSSAAPSLVVAVSSLLDSGRETR